MTEEEFQFQMKLLGGMKVVPQSEISTAQWHVCADQPEVPGSREGKCTVCLAPVFFSDNAGTLPKICLKCVTPMLRADEKPEVLVTAKTIHDVAAILANKKRKN